MIHEPYGRIRTLRREIQDYKYELRCIDMGVRADKNGTHKKRWEGYIAGNRAEIKAILAEVKANKLTVKT